MKIKFKKSTSKIADRNKRRARFQSDMSSDLHGTVEISEFYVLYCPPYFTYYSFFFVFFFVQETTNLSLQMFEMLENRKEKFLNTSYHCFNSANEVSISLTK